MNITGNTIVKRSIKNGNIGKLTAVQWSNKAHLFEFNARQDAGATYHDRMGVNRDFQLYSDIYKSQSPYGPSEKKFSGGAYMSGRQHNWCNECNGMGWLIAIVATVAGFGLSYMMSLGIRKELEDHGTNTPPATYFARSKTYKVDQGEQGYQADSNDDEYPAFWNWVIAGAGAILSLVLATTCLHCCAKSKNKIEARHSLAGAELAGFLTDSGKSAPSGAIVKQKDSFGMPLPPNQPIGMPPNQPIGMPPNQSMGMPPNQRMGMPPNRPMGMPPIHPMPPTGMLANEPMTGGMNMPPATYATKTKGMQPSDPDLFIGPIDENTRKFKQGKMIIHRPKVEVKEEIVGYDITEIALKDPSRSNRRHRSNRRLVVEDSDN